MTYLGNGWYMAGWAHELDVRPIARRICGIPVLIYRKTASTIVALLDRCPHRFAPLSLGDVKSGHVRCRYHGLVFDREGACISNPHGPINTLARVRPFPVVERDGAIWIWPGDGPPDEARLPDFSFIGRMPATATSQDYLLVHAHYLIVVDNILDLSHVDHLHRETLGGGGPAGSGTFTGVEPSLSRHPPDGLTLCWSVENATPRQLEQQTMALSRNERVRRRTKLVWKAPATITLRTVVETKGGIAAQSFENTHVISPETNATSHYFFSSTRDFAVDDAHMNAEIAATRRRIFLDEDEWMCRAVQDRMEGSDFWQLRPALLKTDAASIQVRRMLDRLLTAEHVGKSGQKP